MRMSRGRGKKGGKTQHHDHVFADFKGTGQPRAARGGTVQTGRTGKVFSGAALKGLHCGQTGCAQLVAYAADHQAS